MITAAAFVATFALGFVARGVLPAEPVAYAQAPRVFELRTYTVGDGKLDLLHARFRNQTGKFFQRHGMTQVWYGKPMDAPASANSMTYLLAFPSREAATRSWAAFRMDQEWAAVAKESGVGQVQIQSVFFEPADYSPLK
jgi:hypothetical protein